jgi:putative aldouronate transport system permease protein
MKGVNIMGKRAIERIGNKKGFLKTPGEKFFDILILVTVIILTILFLYPFIYVLSVSFNDPTDTLRGGIVLFPRKFSTIAYKTVMKNSMLLNAYAVTIARTVIGSAVSVFSTGIFAYGLSKKKLMFRNFYLSICLITMFFSGGLIPSVILIKNLGLTNSFLVYIIPAMINVFNMLVMKSFFVTLPASLEEAATIDGCSDIGVFFRIVIPASLPIIATMALFNSVAQWNSWLDAYLYISDQKLMPLQTILQRILNQAQASQILKDLALGDDIASNRITPQSIQLATMIISIGPIVAVYPFFQKYFVKGFLVGAIKE